MSLEKNIERIADALEAIAGLKGAGRPNEGNAAASQQAPTQPPQQQAPQAMQGNRQPANRQPQGGQVPVSQPAGMGAQWQGGNAAQPGNMPPQQKGAPAQQPAGGGTVPTTAAAQQYTFDQLAVATANLASSGRDVFTILGRFGISMLMDLSPERYGEYAAALREAGAVI